MSMNGNEHLEHLISRFLDNEATPAERRDLNAQLACDPLATALYEQTAALDREVGRAMRLATGRTLLLRPLTGRRGGWSRLIGVAAAAALAGILILRGQPLGDADAPLQAGGNWGFLPAEPPGDTFVAPESQYPLPHVQLRDTHRDWLLVPAEQPGQFLVIEVQRVQTRAVGIHNDY
jgi:hypothetical protein